MNYASQRVSDGDGDLCPLRYCRKGTDKGADGKPLVTLGLTKLERSVSQDNVEHMIKRSIFVHAPNRRLGVVDDDSWASFIHGLRPSWANRFWNWFSKYTCSGAGQISSGDNEMPGQTDV